MESENNYLVQIDEIINELEDDLEIKSVTFNRLKKHFDLMTKAKTTLEIVTGRTSPEAKRISGYLGQLWMIYSILKKEDWQKNRKRMSSEEKTDNDNTNRSLMIKRTTHLLNVFKKVKKTHFKSFTSTTSPIQDAEYVLSISGKNSLLQASGIIVSNYIASLLTDLLEKENIKFNSDDIIHLKDTLIDKSAILKLKEFLRKSHRRVENAHNVRNRSAHIDRAKLTRIEVEHAIEFAKLLRDFK